MVSIINKYNFIYSMELASIMDGLSKRKNIYSFLIILYDITNYNCFNFTNLIRMN